MNILGGNTERRADGPPRLNRPVMRSIGDASEPLVAGGLGIALVRGPIVFTEKAINNEAVPTLGLAYIAGQLHRQGYSPVIVDAVAEGLNQVWPWPERPGYVCQGLTFSETIGRIPDDAAVIGISVNFSGEWPVHRQLIEDIRRQFPDAVLVAGGEHVTALTEFVLRDCPALDMCVRGEGELIFYEIVECVRRGGEFSSLPGISYLDEGGAYVEPAALARVKDIDNIPWPYWPDGYLERFWAAGKSFGVQTSRDMPMLISRGCPFQCTFCSSPQMWTTRYVIRDADDVIAEIEHYVKTYGITAVQLYDLTAIIKKSWIMELCRKLKERDIRINWSLPSGTRSEALDREAVTLLKETGCNYLVYAPESGSERTLKLIKKKISLKKLTESVLTSKRLGLVLRVNLIIGFPHETRADVFRTVFYGIKLAIRGVDEVSINIFSPYPGSELFEELRNSGQLQVDDDYFLSLTSINSDFTDFNPITFNPVMKPRELGIYRLTFMLINYGLGYLIYPWRIVRTLRNIFSETGTTTVFEHRLKDILARRGGSAASG